MADSVAIPFAAAAGNGHGDAINVMRTTRDFIAAGAAGIRLGGRRVIAVDGSVGKFRAAARIRVNSTPTSS